MHRIHRLTAILIQLQTKRIVGGKEIAERFGISLRTVYRDIRALEDAGVPIGAEAGLGYFLAPGYHLPPAVRPPPGKNVIVEHRVSQKAFFNHRDHRETQRNCCVIRLISLSSLCSLW